MKEEKILSLILILSIGAITAEHANAQENIITDVRDLAVETIDTGTSLVTRTTGVLTGNPEPWQRNQVDAGPKKKERFRKERGLYVGVKAGQSTVEAKNSTRNEDGINFDFDTEDDDLSQMVYCGYWINRHVAFELASGSLGQITVPFNFSDPRNGRDGTGEAEVDITGTSACLMLAIDKAGWQGHLRLGANSWDRSLDSRFDVVGEESVRRKQSRTGTGLVYGAGVSYEFSRGFILRGEAEQYDIDGDSVQVVSLGIQYDFGSFDSWFWDY